MTLWGTVLLGYIVLINLASFIIFGFDKWMAVGQKRRVSEARLWLFALLGGTIGSLIAMSLFRHKTRKASFRLVFFGIFFFQIVLLLFLFWYFGVVDFSSFL